VDKGNEHWIATDSNDANQDHDDAICPDIQKLVKARAWDSNKHLRLVLSEIRDNEIPVPFANMNLGWLTFQTDKISIDLLFAALCIANNMYGMATSATNAVRTVYGVHTNDNDGEVHFVLSVADFEYKEQFFDDFVRWSPACNDENYKADPASFGQAFIHSHIYQYLLDNNHGANRTGGEYSNGGVHSLIFLAAYNGGVHSSILVISFEVSRYLSRSSLLSTYPSLNHGYNPSPWLCHRHNQIVYNASGIQWSGFSSIRVNFRTCLIERRRTSAISCGCILLVLGEVHSLIFSVAGNGRVHSLIFFTARNRRY